MGDIGARIEESKNWFERAAERVPGYKGYKQKELRREADKIQRTFVAERLEFGRRALENLELDISRSGKLDILGIVDTVARKLRTVKDRFLFADYGYAGWFDAVKVDQGVLDSIYQLDAQAQEAAVAIEQLAKSLRADSPSLRADIDILDERVEALDEFFAQRDHVVTGAGR
ncbi:MAG: hypothetical protein GX604_06020 [Actinobacteria bacterium]|nr:hypothetical protein [Actinomycetota bacterium]